MHGTATHLCSRARLRCNPREGTGCGGGQKYVADSFVTQASRRPLPDSGDERSDFFNEVKRKKKNSRHVQSSKQKKRLIPDTNSDEQKLPKKKPTPAKVCGHGWLLFIALAGAPQE